MNTNRYLSLRFRLAIVLIFLAALFSVGVSSVLYINFRRELRESLRHRLENITTLAALQQDGDAFILVEAEGDLHFRQIQEKNLNIRRSDPDLRFVYTMRRDEQGIYFVVDGGLPSEEGYSPFGTRYLEPGPALKENFDTIAGTLLEPDFYTDEYGTFLSGYAPILNSSGQQVGVLGVDITANTIISQERAYLFQILTIEFVALILIVLAGILAADYLARPIVRLRDAANKISSGDFSYRITNIPETRELAELAVDFNAMTANLSSLITDLERRVSERTEDITKKTDQLRAASYIARQTAEIQDLSLLLNLVVKLVSDQFGFYHAGIFLINEAGDEITLEAASSEGGRQMVEKGHTLKVGAQGMVGYVAAQKKPRIALDVGTDAVFFNNPYLPMTRSEIALPLLVRGKVVGVLDIQSDKTAAFAFEDMDVLETLADQVAVAIDNARLLDESQAAFLQLEALAAIRTREAWSQKLAKRQRAFTYTPLGLRAEKPSESDENAIKVPITLRGQKIGSISLVRRNNAAWNKLDEDLVMDVATQAGLAVDNIRLLEEATDRAKQEQIVGELAFRFSQSLDIDSLLQTATREFGQLPGVEEATVYIGDLETTPDSGAGSNPRGTAARMDKS
jgi:GAF domain-containing protein/HAMP domain-containing protein